MKSSHINNESTARSSEPNFSSKNALLDDAKHYSTPKFVFGQGGAPNFCSKTSLLDDAKHYSTPKFVFGQGGAPKKPTMKTPQPSRIVLPPQTMSTRKLMMGLHLSNDPSSPSHACNPRETGRSCIPRPSSPSQINPFGPDDISLGNGSEYMDDGYSHGSSSYSSMGTNATFSELQR